VVVDEELSDLAYKSVRKIGITTNIGVEVRGLGDGEKAIVADPLSALALFRFEDADQSDGDEAAGNGRLVHQDQNIQRITVTPASARHKTEIVGEDHSGGKHFFEGKDSLFGIEVVLVAAAPGSFDDDLEHAVVGPVRRQVYGIGERASDAHESWSGAHREMLLDRLGWAILLFQSW
jgi:hypothetical protein